MCSIVLREVDFPRFTFLSITKQNNSRSQCSFPLTLKGIKLVGFFLILPMESLYFRQPCWPLPSRSGVLTQTQNSICKHFWHVSSSRVHSSPGPAFAPELSDAIRKTIFKKECKVLFSHDFPRQSVPRCAAGERSFRAAHSAPREDAEADAASSHTATGTGTLQAAPTANAVPGQAWGWGWTSRLGDFGSLEKYVSSWVF